MVRDVLTIEASANLVEAARRMLEGNIGMLPVVDAEERPIGIVTLSSLALRARDDDEALSAAKEVSRRSAKGAPGPTLPSRRATAPRATRRRLPRAS